MPVVLGAEILDDDFLDMAVALVQIAQRQQRVDPLGARLADADQDAGGERHVELARRLDRGEPRRRGLVGRAVMRAAALRTSRGDTFSSIMPCDTDTRRSAAISASLITPGLTCGSSPVSRSTSAHIAAR